MAGRLMQLFPDWTLPSVPISLVYPSRRELAPAVRAFADFMRESAARGQRWQVDPLIEQDILITRTLRHSKANLLTSATGGDRKISSVNGLRQYLPLGRGNDQPESLRF
jgi:hypothetical protein